MSSRNNKSNSQNYDNEEAAPSQQIKRSNNARPKQVRAFKPKRVEDQPQQQHPRPRAKTGLAASLGTPIPRGSNPDAFKPQALSTNATAERNDPMLLDCILVEGVSASISCARERNFSLDFSTYVQIIRSSYLVMTRLDRGLQKYLSYSTYQYYAFILLWRRIRYVLTERGEKVNEYEDLVRTLPPLAVPDELGHYLDGIGNIRDYNDSLCYLTMLDHLRMELISGISGHFGKIDHTTHISYETMPSPFVALYRMLHDVAQSRAKQARLIVSTAWDLPADLVPDGNLTPNRNLLGWDISAPLTAEQLQMLTDAGLDAEVTAAAQPGDPPVVTFDTHTVENKHGVPILYHVLLQVSELLSGSKSPYNNHATSTNTNGTIAQSGFIVRDRCDMSHNISGRNLTPIYEREGTWHVHHQASIHICNAGSLFRYRIQRKVPNDNTTADSLAYTHTNGTPPHRWNENANIVYNSFPDWNMRNFRTTMTAGRQIADHYSEKIRRMSPRTN